MLRFVLPISLGVGLLFAVLPALAPTRDALAQVVTGLFRGAGHGGATIERFRFKTQKGNRGFVKIDREIVVAPAEYGDLVTITQNLNHTTLWFRDAEGNVRNVILTKDHSLVKVVRADGLAHPRD